MRKKDKEKIIKNENGAIITLTAILLPVLLAFLGIAYDFGHLYMEKGRLQNIADAAALAGLEELKDQLTWEEPESSSFPCLSVQLQTIQKAPVLPST